MKTLLAAIFALSCAIGPTGTRPTDARAVGDFGPEVPTLYLTIYQWEQTPWYRTTDSFLDTPIHIVLSREGWACLVDGADWALAIPNELFDCRSGWRRPRPR